MFVCSATSEPMHSVRWEREGVVIAQFLSPDDRTSTIEKFCRLNCDQLQRNTSVTIDNKIVLAGVGNAYGQLTIREANRTDAREYTCIIANTHGSLSASARLTVQGKHIKFKQLTVQLLLYWSQLPRNFQMFIQETEMCLLVVT